MITTRQVAQHLQGMCEPGQSVIVTRHIMQEMSGCIISDFMGEFSAADRILGHIIGSSYEWSYRVDPASGNTIFSRMEKPLEDGRRTFVDPDRRHLFTKLADGTYELN